jgi:DNA (cytosine-5)-methyltransferase 1
VRTTVVVEWDRDIATWCRKNIHALVLTLDLLQVKEVHAALLPFLPLHSVQISSSCTDFLTAGKGVEGESAFVTVTATMIAVKLGVPLILYENVPRMLTSKAWSMAAALLAAAGYIWSSVVVNAIDCGVPQNRRRVFVAATRQGPRAAQRLHAWR